MDINEKIADLKKQQAEDRELYESLESSDPRRGTVFQAIDMIGGEIERLEKERARAELDVLRDRLGDVRSAIIECSDFLDPAAWGRLQEVERVGEDIDAAEEALTV